MTEDASHCWFSITSDRKLWSRVSVVLLSLSTSSCSAFGGCTERGCTTALELQFAQPMAEGAHLFGVTTPDGSATCQVHVEGGTSTGDCDGDLQVIFLSSSLQVLGTPSEATVTHSANGQHQGTAWVSDVEYEQQFPNGEHCDAGCLHAEETIDFVVR